MAPTTKQIVWQLRALAELHPKDTISELASKLALSPIFIINALDEGEKMEWLQRKRDKKGKLTEALDILLPTQWVVAYRDSEFGPDYKRVADEIDRAIVDANADEQDLEFGTIMAWCRGINPSAVEIALEMFTQLGRLRTYELADPKDKKSIYKFYSLNANADNQWGKKQFKK